MSDANSNCPDNVVNNEQTGENTMIDEKSNKNNKITTPNHQEATVDSNPNETMLDKLQNENEIFKRKLKVQELKKYFLYIEKDDRIDIISNLNKFNEYYTETIKISFVSSFDDSEYLWNELKEKFSEDSEIRFYLRFLGFEGNLS